MFEEIEDINKAIDILSKKRLEIKDRLISENHPVAIGDELVVNYKYSHSGKTIVVDNLHLVYAGYPERYVFAASGKIKKKNGTHGVYEGWWADL